MTQMLYKCPGNSKRPDHIKIGDNVIDYLVVEDADVDGALKDGWVASPEEAIAGTKKAPAKRKPTTRKRATPEDSEVFED